MVLNFFLNGGTRVVVLRIRGRVTKTSAQGVRMWIVHMQPQKGYHIRVCKS